MVIQLPEQPNDARVNLPPAPQNPPIARDLLNANNYKTSVLTSAASISDVDNISTEEDVAKAIIYEHNVTQAFIAAQAGVVAAPAWFAPVQKQLDTMEGKISSMQQSLAILRNNLNHDCKIHPFSVVPFEDGSYPTEAPYNLIALTNTTIINGLSADVCRYYLDGYNVTYAPGEGDITEWHKLLRIAIGCRTYT